MGVNISQRDNDLVFLSQDSLDCQASGELGTLTPAAPARSAFREPKAI